MFDPRWASIGIVLAIAGCHHQQPAAPADTGTVATAKSVTPAPAATVSPSFDCGKAEGKSQQLVCRDPNLAAMDVETDRLFRLVVADPSLSAARRSELRATERGWIKGRDDCWKADDLRQCVMSNYASRIHELRQGYAAARSQDDQGESLGPVAFRCAGLDALVGATFVNSDPGAVWLEWRDHAMALDHVRSGSGARYAATLADGEYVFWNKGRDAILQRPGQPDLQCSEDKTG